MQKKSFAALAFCLAAVFLNAQTTGDSLELRRDLNTYMRVSQALEYDSIIGFMPPKMFGFVSKNDLKGLMQSAFETEEFKMEFGDMRFLDVKPIVKGSDLLFTMVDYEMSMSITFASEQDSSFKVMLQEVFEAQYGKENVRPDAANPARINIFVANKKMFAIREPDWDSWKFFEDKRNQTDAQGEQLLEAVIPKEVLDRFK
jgi:hypothetical protein